MTNIAQTPLDKTAVTLSLKTLSHLPSTIARPSYHRSEITPGILHFGVGNFHRAHLAVYLDDLFNQGLNKDWGIIGAGVMPSDAAMRDRLIKQDFLTTIIEQDQGISSARVIGSMIDFISPDDRDALFQALSDPRIRIVSLTITEGGYFIDSLTGAFDATHPAIVEDGANPDAAKTVFGILVAGLKLRQSKGLAPFTIMSCDNVPHNGSVTRNAVVGVARLSDPAMAEWINANVAFPNAMVDRITPATTERERHSAMSDFGIIDASPVFCEAFKQWVLEDHFPLGRPSFDKVGATFVKDVSPFETMKIRILNGGHAILAYSAGLLDIHYVHEAMNHPLVRDFLIKIEQDEIIPIVPPVPGVNLQDYFNLIIRRFSNPAIGDTIRRLCLDGSNRQPKFIVPSIADALQVKRSIKGLALESALWCRYCYGVTESGAVIEANDPNWDFLQTKARAARLAPSEWLAMDHVYSTVSTHQDFVDVFETMLKKLWTDGVVKTLSDYLENKL